MLRNKKTPKDFFGVFYWRRVGDSNPRTLSQVNSFQDCRNRPLCQLSTAKVQIRRETANPDSIFFSIFILSPP
jgi:hypothetical protein